jgi:hypothetical protein
MAPQTSLSDQDESPVVVYGTATLQAVTDLDQQNEKEQD